MEEKTNFSIVRNFKPFFIRYKTTFMILIVFNIGLGLIDSVFPLLNKYAIDEFVTRGNIEGLKKFSLLYFMAVIGLSFFVYGFIRLAGKLEKNLAYDIRVACFDRLQGLSLEYYDTNATGSIMSRMTSDINRLTEIIAWGLVDLCWGFSMMIAVSFSMYRLNGKLASIIVLMLPVAYAVSRYFRVKILDSQRKVREINGQITSSYNEDIQGARTTKVLLREDRNLEEFSRLTDSMREKSIKSISLSSIYIPIILFLGGVGTSLVLTVGGNEIMKGALSYGSLVAFISYSGQFFEPINQMAIIFSEFQTAKASAERIHKLLEEESDIEDSLEVIEKFGPKGDRNLPLMKGDIEFVNVGFSYSSGEKIIENFNLKVRAGETIALVGATGAGKSTIVNLLCRFYEPRDGEILVDGLDYRKLPKEYMQKNLGYVLQTPHLFNGSIRENILYGNLGASEEDMIRASKLVNAHDFIVKFDEGYDSMVAEGGGLLSQGQKQLISFARAVIRDPRLFVLDEATSSIDTNTELIIQDAIDNILEERTSFIIAHRLSTIKNADRILVLEDGKILEEGSHEELIRKKANYYNLFTNQFLKE